MPEGLSPSEVGEQIAEHHEHAAHSEHHDHVTRDRAISIIEAALLSIVALMAAWSGCSAAKWGSESSLALAQASGARSDASADQIQATQIRALDSVSFNAVEGAYVAHDTKLFDLAVRRLRAGYKPAFNAWLALHPLKPERSPGPVVPAAMPCRSSNCWGFQDRRPDAPLRTASDQEADGTHPLSTGDAGAAGARRAR
jgi:hypothetical protein